MRLDIPLKLQSFLQ